MGTFLFVDRILGTESIMRVRYYLEMPENSSIPDSEIEACLIRFGYQFCCTEYDNTIISLPISFDSSLGLQISDVSSVPIYTKEQEEEDNHKLKELENQLDKKEYEEFIGKEQRRFERSQELTYNRFLAYRKQPDLAG